MVPVTAVNWIDILGSGAFAEGEAGSVIVRCSQATRVAVGVADPVASTTAGIPVTADTSVLCLLDTATTEQSIWVQTAASGTAQLIIDNTFFVELDPAGPSLVATAVIEV